MALRINALLLGGQFTDPGADPATDPGAGPVTGPGADGRRAEALLARAQAEGVQALNSLTRGAVERLVRRRAAGHGDKPAALFTEAERRQLGRAIARTLAPAHLLGAARIRRRANQVEQHYADRDASTRAPRDGSGTRRFRDVPTDLRCFDENTGGIEPMTPAEAAAYFTRTVPGLEVNGRAFADMIGRDAFTLAVTTDATLLDKVYGIVADVYETGEGITEAPGQIDAILAAAGVSPANPQYSDMLVRTNLMEGYNTGGMRELAAVADTFPAWEYHNPDDSRSRPHHAERSGRYWPTARDFADVRGTDAADVCNCRCTFVPIDAYEWADLQAAGERAEE